MPLIVHLTSLLLQILLFCPETDGASTITWYEPPPVETTADTSLIRTNNTQLIEGSTNVELHWKFSLDADLMPIQSVHLELNTARIVNIAPSFNRIEVLSAYKHQFNVSWINNEKVTLIIFNVTDADVGEFVCEVTTLGGVTKIWTRKIQVDVVAPPKFTSKSPSPQKVNETLDLQLVCEARGKPPPNITWTKDGSDSVLHTRSTLNLTNINGNNAGTYQCTADNGVGSAQHTIEVIVEFSPRIDLNVIYYVAREGNAYLDCRTKGYPPPTITWTPCDSQKNIKCDESFLNISKLLVSRAIYTCKASNYLGDASANTTLVIGGKDIYLTLIITDVECTEENGQAVYDQPIWKELKSQVDALFQRNSYMYIVTEQLDDRCGSVHVDLVLKFKNPVAEDWVLSILRGAVLNGKLGKLSVNASSIVGIPPVIKSTVTPPKTTPTPPNRDDSNIALIVGLVVGGVVLVAIIVAVILLWRKKKCCNCCATDSKEVSNDEAAGPQKSGTLSGTGNNGYVDSGSAYAQPDLSSCPPTKTTGKKEKKPAKKGKDPQPAALPLYAQVDKTKKKPREPENTYDDANDQRRRQPGEVTYTTLDHSDQGTSLPRGAANQTTRPPPYTETTYAVLV